MLARSTYHFQHDRSRRLGRQGRRSSRSPRVKREGGVGGRSSGIDRLRHLSQGVWISCVCIGLPRFFVVQKLLRLTQLPQSPRFQEKQRANEALINECPVCVFHHNRLHWRKTFTSHLRRSQQCRRLASLDEDEPLRDLEHRLKIEQGTWSFKVRNRRGLRDEPSVMQPLVSSPNQTVQDLPRASIPTTLELEPP